MQWSLNQPDQYGMGRGIDTQHAAAIIVLAAIALLVIIRLGFRGGIGATVHAGV